MAAPHSPSTNVVIAPLATQYINWPAVFAGNAVTGGLILVMLPLGAAAGLAMTSPYPNTGSSAATVGAVAIFWLAFMYLFSISAGGYVVGRLRPRVGDATLDEVRFRDGVNGLVFWGLGMIISALFTFLTLASAAGTATTAVGQAVGGATSAAASALPSVNTDYVSDLLLRATATGPQQTAAQPRSDADVRSEIARIVTATAASGQITDVDKKYVSQLIAQRTGVSEADAAARVDDGVKRATQMKDEASAKAREFAESARKGASRAAFWTAVLSLLSGIAAIYAARLGGQHRDEGRF